MLKTYETASTQLVVILSKAAFVAFWSDPSLEEIESSKAEELPEDRSGTDITRQLNQVI